MGRYNTQKITVTGHLTKNAEARVTPGGDDYIDISIAVNSYRKGFNDDNRKTTFYSARVYGKSVMKLAEYAKKGCMILATGDYDQNVSEKNGKTSVFNNINNATIEILSSPDRSAEDSAGNDDGSLFDDM